MDGEWEWSTDWPIGTYDDMPAGLAEVMRTSDVARRFHAFIKSGELVRLRLMNEPDAPWDTAWLRVYTPEQESYDDLRGGTNFVAWLAQETEREHGEATAREIAAHATSSARAIYLQARTRETPQ